MTLMDKFAHMPKLTHFSKQNFGELTPKRKDYLCQLSEFFILLPLNLLNLAKTMILWYIYYGCFKTREINWDTIISSEN